MSPNWRFTIEFDLIVIGAGPAGYVGAVRAAQLGLKVCIIDKGNRLGGTCLNIGCIPTKALLYASKFYRKISHASDFGVVVKNYKLDMKKMHAYKDRIVEKLGKGVEFLMKKNKIAVVQGTATFVDSNTVEVNGKKSGKIKGKKILIATGSKVGSLPGLKLDGKNIISSDDALRLSGSMKSILIVGAGAVGVEFATYYNNIGVKVTLVELMPDIVPLEDVDISKELKKQFERTGIEIHVDSNVSSAKKKGKGMEAVIETKNGKVKKVFDKILIAVGRKPVTDTIGIEKTRAKVDDKGYVEVNDRYQTADNNIYAIGDIIKTPWLAHVGSYEGIKAAEYIAGKDSSPINYDKIPNCTFCQPEVASIGLSEQEAKNRKIDYKTSKFPFSAIGKAMILNESEGFIKIVADKKYSEVLGIHIIHPEASLLVGEAVQILNGEFTVEEISNGMHPHPTLTEIFAELAHLHMGEPIHL